MIKQQVPLSGKSFFAINYFNALDKNILLTLINEEEAIRAYKQALFFAKNAEILYFPSIDTIPYDRVSPNQHIMSERANVLSHLATSKGRKIVITNAANLLVKLPPPSIFVETTLKLYRNMKFTSEQLASFLVKNGFIRSANALDIGEFALRGEIVDIVLSSDKAYRVNFSWDQIESIKKYDIDSQISHSRQEELIINAANEIILNSETINNFKSNYLQNFGVNKTNTPLYRAIIEGRKFPGYENLLPLFYNKLNMLLDYLVDPTIILYDSLSWHSIVEFENSYKDFYQSRIQSNKINPAAAYPALAPEQICFPSSRIKEVLNHQPNIFLEPNSNVIARLEDITKLLELIANNSQKIIIIFCHSKSGLERLKNIAQHYKYNYREIDKLEAARGNGVINFAEVPLSNGFYTDEYLFISEKDIFGNKFANSSTQSSKRRLKNILTELDNLSEGDLIVHKDHGIGKFITCEIIEVSGKPHDCLKISYADNDKLYIPVENIESIKKYGAYEAELDKLGGVSWQKRKAKVKNRITEIASKLLQITARRKTTTIEPVEFDLAAYDQFCARFNYTETEDQIKAIDEIRSDLASGILMDRLICGDVGFGKTEVAMRATYIIAKSNQMLTPQVAIISPTTILCKQHYSRFLERFANLGLNIVQLSRLIKNSEAKKVKDQIKNGTANIIIGTHALLANNIEFSNLKLLIIDEEQHFGVSQKERLKELKSDIHVLSLSATPIPRTLQMSLVGLKDLSLITMPPVDRLAVHTTVMSFDPLIIRDALLKEHFRGGRSFYVVPLIKDIEEIEGTLKTIVPELKFKVAHGQMPPALIDEIMTEFYDGKFDILLSTTIIESGIDIPAANTMIIHKANKLGLSQLYQLKGRIGRSKIRGYAYLTLAINKPVSKHSIKRLEIIQNASSLGSGFTIASHDMDLRGFGNLVGEEQSGQIKEVGVELYQDMLDEQVAILKNEPSSSGQTVVPTINLGLPILIPDSYITDSSLRLAIYRRIGDLLTNQEVESFKDEMIDRFGPIPAEFDNLLAIVKIKQICNKLNIGNLDSGQSGFVLKFHHNNTSPDLVIKFVNKYPSQAKIKPDNKLIFIQNLKQVNIIDAANELLYKLESLSNN